MRLHILKTFLVWLESQAICCGDQGQPPTIADIMSHSWLREKADYYEEAKTDHRVTDDKLKA